MSVDTKKAADGYWGLVPSGAPTGEARDPQGLGPPPRAQTPQLLRYEKRATPSLFVVWLGLAVFFGASHLLMIAIVPTTATSLPLLPLLFAGLAVWSGRKRGEQRRRIGFVLREGRFTDAEVKDVRVVEKRYGRRVVYEYHVLFDLGHRKVELVTRDPGASLLQVGLRDQVLWHEREPAVVVPTYLVAAG